MNPQEDSTSSEAPLLKHLPPADAVDADSLLEGFLEAVAERGLELYPAQEEAILEVMSGRHVILNTPTGSGKSLVAEAMHFKCMAENRRSFYTCPIKALVSEKFFALCAQFGPQNVGMMTGDATINRDAKIVCCTAEILSNMALREGALAQVDCAVIDEFHYYSDRDRGVAWQTPLLLLPNTTFLLMSATLGDCEQIQQSLEQFTNNPVAMVRSAERPVPLDYSYQEAPIHETIAKLIEDHKFPVYIVNFTQKQCAEQAQNLMSSRLCSKEEKQSIDKALKEFRFDTTYGREISRFVRNGVGLHHAGLLPKYRLLVEQLAQTGLLKVICGTDTLGVGVNIPIRTVLFARLCKYDGEKVGILSIRDFKQISGRAGRKGFDEEGSVVCQAPEYVVENRKIEAKALSGNKKKNKIVKKKPPTKNFVNWDQATFERLISKPPETMVSRFAVTHGMLLHMLQGGADTQQNGYRNLCNLIQNSHETDRAKSKHRRHAALLFQSLRKAGIISVVNNPESGNRVVINTDLQADFSLNHTLSLYLLEALPQLDPESETLAVDVLTLVESVLEDPRVILMRQVDKLFTIRLAELKAEGMEYDERMAELEKLEHPKPNRDFIYNSFNAFADKHPWVGHENIRPKSVVREIYERYCTFNEYVAEYGIKSSEGLLLRYLSDCYKTLLQNVPDQYKDDSVYEILAFLRTMLRQVDSSLIQEWEQMLEPSAAPLPEQIREKRIKKRNLLLDPEANPRAFQARVRAEMHALVNALYKQDYQEATNNIRQSPHDPWTAERFEEAMAPYYQDHDRIVFDHSARYPSYTLLQQLKPQIWQVRQVIVDPEENNDWMLEGEIDIDQELSPDSPLTTLVRIGV